MSRVQQQNLYSFGWQLDHFLISRIALCRASANFLHHNLWFEKISWSNNFFTLKSYFEMFPIKNSYNIFYTEHMIVVWYKGSDFQERVEDEEFLNFFLTRLQRISLADSSKDFLKILNPWYLKNENKIKNLKHFLTEKK